MSADVEQARKAIARCRALRQNGVVEAVLRGEFQSRLRGIFPDADDERWINHYGEGAEAHRKISRFDGVSASRFIDNLIGFTSIEYESDLRITAKRKEGYCQIKEHAVGLLHGGAPRSQIRVILSDTVDWYAYGIGFKSCIESSSCTIEDIELSEIERFEPVADNESTAKHLILFLRRHFAREQSRPLVADYLALDIGLESPACRCSINTLTTLVEAERAVDPSVKIATELWSHFVDHLEDESGNFRVGPYVDEIYLSIIARLLIANFLAKLAIISNDRELEAILNGSYFQNKYQLYNLVEKDYFHWIVSSNHIAKILLIAHKIQGDLYAYDFSSPTDKNLFGRLMAQLAQRSQRKLLGQEWTPNWLAKHLAECCLDNLPKGEMPKIIDMCCGSGSILTEVIKAAKSRYGYEDIASLQSVVTGFDIDPLAVAFAKTTWVITLADEIRKAVAPITIPVYHADSFFAVTPISASIPTLGENAMIEITLDGQSIKLPVELVQPEYRALFDRIIDWAHDEAIQTSGRAVLTSVDAKNTLDTVIADTAAILSSELRQATAGVILALAQRMKVLADSGRNGIWAFILRNTYQPGFLTGQFNGLASNPPWLAMSALADNPYYHVLSRRAALYGIKPGGSSFPHLELGTTYLLHAIDRYLKSGAAVACLVPGTILNGHHHERFRQRDYLHSGRPVAFSVTEVWRILPKTFNYPGAVLIGKKVDQLAEADISIERGSIAQPEVIKKVEFSEQRIDKNRTAWVIGGGSSLNARAGHGKIPQQGADMMPRRAVCIEILSKSRNEYRVGTPARESEWGFTVKDAKQLSGEQFSGYVATRFIHHMAQSKNLLTFVLGPHRAPVAIPATRGKNGKWHIHDPASIRRMGFTRTARHFATINDKLKTVGIDNTLEHRINERRKLSHQVFPESGYVVLSGAGGTYICAAWIPVAEARGLVVDQTLYWQVVPDEEEAWFMTGMLNSDALTAAISPFNPRGGFGPRHIHTLPYRLMPPYARDNDDHQIVVEAAKTVAKQAVKIVERIPSIGNPSGALHVRRKKLRKHLTQNAAFQELERHCAIILDCDTDLGE